MTSVSSSKQGECLTEDKLTDLLTNRELSWNTKEFIRLILTEERESHSKDSVIDGFRV